MERAPGKRLSNPQLGKVRALREVRGDKCRLPQAHPAAAGRLRLCPAGDDPSPDPLVSTKLPAASRDQRSARARRRQARQAAVQAPSHRLRPHRHRQGQDRGSQTAPVRGRRSDLRVRLPPSCTTTPRSGPPRPSWRPSSRRSPAGSTPCSQAMACSSATCPSTAQGQPPVIGCTCSTGSAASKTSSTGSPSQTIPGQRASSRRRPGPTQGSHPSPPSLRHPPPAKRTPCRLPGRPQRRQAPQDSHNLRNHLQSMALRTRPLPIRSDPPHFATQQPGRWLALDLGKAPRRTRSPSRSG